MNELILNVSQNPGSIKMNLDELEEMIDKILKEYKGAVFTDDTMDIAKKERAGLRALKKDLDDTRKNVKKEWMKPYDDFEVEVKNLLEKIDVPVGVIDKQVKEFEEKKREEKRGKIREIYKECAAGLEEYIPLEKIYDFKWENATTSIKSIKESILAYVEDARTSVDTIKGMASEKEEDALEVYKQTLSVAKAIAVISDYERQKAEILAREKERRQKEEVRRRQEEIDRAKAEERQKQAEIERVREEERQKAEAAVAKEEAAKQPATEQPLPFDAEDDGALPFEQPTTITAYYRVVASREELERVEMAFNSIGIYFERRDA